MNDEKIRILETFTGTNFENFKIRAKYGYSYSILNINRNRHFIVYPILENYKIAKNNLHFKNEILLFLILNYLNIMYYIKGNNFSVFKWKKSFNYYVRNASDLTWVDDFLNEFYKWYYKKVMKDD